VIKEQRKNSFCEEQEQNHLTANGEYILDVGRFLYRRMKGKQPEQLVPPSMIQDAIAKNYNPIFVTPQGGKRTFELVSLNYWWPNIRLGIEEYVRRYNKCQLQKGKQGFRAPLGEVEDPSEPFRITSIDITWP
jgi:hypothetical protein